jgi:hypothetical protein
MAARPEHKISQLSDEEFRFLAEDIMIVDFADKMIRDEVIDEQIQTQKRILFNLSIRAKHRGLEDVANEATESLCEILELEREEMTEETEEAFDSLLRIKKLVVA